MTSWTKIKWWLNEVGVFALIVAVLVFIVWFAHVMETNDESMRGVREAGVKQAEE